MGIPEGKTTALGTKTVGDLQEDIVIKGDKVTGKSKYVTGFTEFNENNPAEQEGNYLVIKVEEATQGKTVMVKMTGQETSGISKKLDPDGILICLIHNQDNKIELTVDSEDTRILDLSELTLMPDVTKVIKPSDGEHQTYNKQVSELQSEIGIAKDGKVTGTLNKVTDYTNDSEHQDGYFLHLHINHENLPSDKIKFGYEGRLVEPDKNDYNYVLYVDEERQSQKVQLELDGKVEYTLDLTGLILSGSTPIRTKKKITTK